MTAAMPFQYTEQKTITNKKQNLCHIYKDVTLTFSTGK
jgi:hypothetical protein